MSGATHADSPAMSADIAAKGGSGEDLHGTNFSVSSVEEAVLAALKSPHPHPAP
jgi:hypothetical protein